MAHLFDRTWSRRELLKHVGDLSQIGGIELAELSDGNQRGVRVANVRSGSGLSFTVLLERGMDIGAAAYKGLPLAWVSPIGFSHPMYFDPNGIQWLRSFGGGLLTGCGLTTAGSAGEDDGEALGLHGRLSNLPAHHVSVNETWQGDECTFQVTGELRQARVFGENLRLERRILTRLGSSCISIRDVVENLGYSPSPLMLVYHINLGFPLLDPGCELLAEAHSVEPRDAAARPGLPEWMRFQEPAPGYAEQVFYHDLPADQNGWAAIQLVNPNRKLGLRVRFQKATLPNLVQWKMMGEGTYILGLEPANCHVEGRSEERKRGTLQVLQPGEVREFNFEIEVSEN